MIVTIHKYLEKIKKTLLFHFAVTGKDIPQGVSVLLAVWFGFFVKWHFRPRRKIQQRLFNTELWE